MALFNRKNRTNVPEEIQEYYQTERRERAGIAWLLAFGTLIVTIVLAAGIFFAGRWAYREIAGSDDGGETPQVAQNEEQQGEQEVQVPDNSTEQSEEERRAEEERQKQEEEDRRAEEERQAAEQRAEQERQEAAEREQAEQQQRDEAERETATTQPTGGSGGGQQVAGAANNIPNTGPGDTAAIFLGATVVGYLLHRIVLRKDQ